MTDMHLGSEGFHRAGGHDGFPHVTAQLLERSVAGPHEAGGIVGGERSAYPDPCEAMDLAEFIGLLGALRASVGMPPYRALAKRVGPLMRPALAASPFTVADAFEAGWSCLELDLVVAIVRALGMDTAGAARWREACIKVRGMAKTGGPVGTLPDRGGAGSPRTGAARRYPGQAAGPSAVERKLLGLLAEGLTDATVAKRLNVSLRTERRMVAELMRRLGASGRFEAGVKAARLRWI